MNVVSIAAELALYLPVPFFGYVCDRYSPRPLALASGILFGVGYLLAAFTYHTVLSRGRDGWPFGIMVFAFVLIGIAAIGMYMGAVTTCAKNFGRAKYRGLALAMPITSFGLSGLWLSQVGSQLLYEREPDGGKGDVDVFRFFLFLAGLLFAAGLIGAIGLQVVDEEELIDEAVEELEESGLLEESAFFQRSANHASNGYGTINPDLQSDISHQEVAAIKADAEGEESKKTWLLNGETRRFLADPTMWFLTGGFFLITGPGEAFINNMGTMVGTLYPPHSPVPASNSAATHVSIFTLSSTLARIISGTLSDLLAPTAPSQTSYRPNSSSSHLALLAKDSRFAVSRLVFLLTTTTILTLSFLLLASPLLPIHPQLFALVSALAGVGYGALFSLTPIIVSVVWGVQNFGTNWGIVAVVPAVGATVWGAVYSAVYTRAAGKEELCWGQDCYEATAWAWAVCGLVTLGLWTWAWRGKGGWAQRGIAV